MIKQAVARRYANAFFMLAKEKGLLDRAEKDLQFVVENVETNQQLKAILGHKLVPTGEKKQLTREIFTKHILPETLNFLGLTIDKRRETFWSEIAVEFGKLADQARNLRTADVIAAVEMKREDITALEKTLSKVTGKNIQVKVTVDPSIIGGLIVKIGDEVMDGSVQKRLDLLKNNLKSINFTVNGVN